MISNPFKMDEIESLLVELSFGELVENDEDSKNCIISILSIIQKYKQENCEFVEEEEDPEEGD